MTPGVILDERLVAGLAPMVQEGGAELIGPDQFRFRTWIRVGVTEAGGRVTIVLRDRTSGMSWALRSSSQSRTIVRLPAAVNRQQRMLASAAEVISRGGLATTLSEVVRELPTLRSESTLLRCATSRS